MSTPPYRFHDTEAIDAGGRFVEFVVDVDNPSIERCYRVSGAFDLLTEEFDLIEVTHWWSNDLVERMSGLGAVAGDIERFVASSHEFQLRLLHAAERERDARVSA
jgi:hypothetical protein